MNYPAVKDVDLVGSYPGLVYSGGGYVWDDVLEYRVWCHAPVGAPDTEEWDDFYYVFDNYEDALIYSQDHPGSESPLALILQKEYINESAPGVYVHVKEERITEWPVEFLKRPRRTANTISDFMSPDAPENRLNILRGLV